MNLEGSLDAFSLPDVLALLAMTKKSGVLRLVRDAGPRGAVQVRDGIVVAASSDEGRQALVRRIVAAGLVDTDALEPAIAAVLDGGASSVPAALVSAGGVPAAALVPVAREQVTDAVFELLRWSEGAFSFGTDAPEPGPADVALPVTELVAEGQRRLAAWPALIVRVPAPSTVLALTPVPEVDPSCTREEWGLLALVDGRRSVTELVALSGRGEWDVVSVLAGLVERGLLAPLADPGAFQRSQELLAQLEGPAPELPVSVPVARAAAPMDALDAELAAVTAAEVSAPVGVPVGAVTASVAGSRPVADTTVTAGALAMQPDAIAVTEGDEDAGVNRALLLRLIAGVRAL